MKRQKLQQEEKRTISVGIWLTKEEYNTACHYAEASGMTRTNWIRYKIFTGKFPQVKLSPVDAALYRQLQMIGVNLNQAVKQLHAGKLSPGFLNMLTALMKTQKDILTCLIK